MDTMRVGPFDWERRDDGRHECWDLVREPDAGMAFFAVKNYGGEPGPGFSGWKLVSGGPFDSAGAYKTREEAMAGVVPFLLDYYERKIAQKTLDLERQIKAHRKFLARMKKVKK